MVIDSLGQGGAEFSLAEMAPHLQGNNIDVHIAYFIKRSGAHEILLGHGIPLYHVAGGGRIARIRALMRLVNTIGPDLIHTSVYEANIAGRVVALLTRKPVTSSLISSTYGRAWFRSGPNPLKLALAYALDLVTCLWVSRFHAVSGSTASTMSKRLLISPQRIVTIYRGRALQSYAMSEPQRREAREELGLGADDHLILCVGRQEPVKCFDDIIAVMPMITAACPKARLMVAGREGAATASLNSMITSLGLQDRVVMLGPRSDIPMLLAASDVFVSTSAREGFAGAVVEALAAGARIVASDIGPVREVTTDDLGVAQVSYFRVGDRGALAKKVITALSTRQNPDTDRRELLARYEIERVSTQMASFYRETVGQ